MNKDKTTKIPTNLKQVNHLLSSQATIRRKNRHK